MSRGLARVLVIVLAATAMIMVPRVAAQSAPAGTIFVVDRDGKVLRVDPRQPSSANQSVGAERGNLTTPRDLVVAPDALLYVVALDCCGGQGGVVRVDPT